MSSADYKTWVDGLQLVVHLGALTVTRVSEIDSVHIIQSFSAEIIIIANFFVLTANIVN